LRDVHIDYAEPAAVAGSLQNVHLAVYRGELTTEALARVHEAHLALLAAHAPTVVFSLAEEGTPLPGAEVRELATRYGNEIAPRIRCSAQVLLGSGFWVSAARSLLTAVLLVRQVDYPMKICSDIGEAARFIEVRNPGGPSSLELERAMRELRRT